MESCDDFDTYRSALTLQPRWLSLVLTGHKVWEIRKKDTPIRQRVALLASGSSLIYGFVEIVNTFHRSKQTLLKKQYEHAIPENLIRKYVKSDGAWVWVLRHPQVLVRPRLLTRTGGTVSFVKMEKKYWEQLVELPYVRGRLEMQEDLLADMVAAAKERKEFNQGRKPKISEKAKKRFLAVMKCESKQFWAKAHRAREPKLPYKAFITIAAWDIFGPQGQVLREALDELAPAVSLNLPQKHLRRLRRCCILLAKKGTLPPRVQQLQDRVDSAL